MDYILISAISGALGFYAGLLLTKKIIKALFKRIGILEEIIDSPYDHERFAAIIKEQISRPSFEQAYGKKNKANSTDKSDTELTEAHIFCLPENSRPGNFR